MHDMTRDENIESVVSILIIAGRDFDQFIQEYMLKVVTGKSDQVKAAKNIIEYAMAIALGEVATQWADVQELEQEN